MRVVFIHSNLPSQYRHLIRHLTQAGTPHQVVCLTRNLDFRIPNATMIHYAQESVQGVEGIPGLAALAAHIQESRAVCQALHALQAKGFVPDVICSHAGLGPDLFVKEVFPDVPLVSYCEWYVSMRHGEWDFDPRLQVGLQSRMQFRVGNSPILQDLAQCAVAVCPTQWQRSRFPAIFQSGITVLHDGIDTRYFRPAESPVGLELPQLALPVGTELLTYVARGMDSVRGFPQFMEAAALVLERRPRCHVVIVGDDRVAYGPLPPQGHSYKAWMLARLPIDVSRVHFVGTLPYDQYLRVLQASTLHVYLTTPFILSWSFLEAMAAGCLLLASDTPPVREVLRDGDNGLLVDFFDTHAMAARIGAALDAGGDLHALRRAARHTVQAQYDLQTLLPRHLRILHDAIEQSRSWSKAGP